MRIGIDARYLSARFSGIGTYSENILKAMAKQKADHEYVVFVHSSFKRELGLPENFEIVPINAAPLSMGTLFGSVKSAYEDAKLDLLHVHFPLLPVTWEGPTVLQLHDLQPFTVPDFTGRRIYPLRRAYDLFYQWAYPMSFEKAQVIISVSHSTRDTLGQFFPDAAARTLVIPNSFDASFLEPAPAASVLEDIALKYRLPQRFILYLGSTRPNKNLPNLLLAYNTLLKARHERAPSLVLVLAKDRFFRDCTAILRSDQELRSRVRILEQVSPSEKRALYYLATGLAYMTKAEGFGIPVLEAQACGCPVAVSDDASLPEVARNSAIYANPDDPADMARALMYLTEDQTVRTELVRRGYHNCRRFSWSRAAKETLNVYKYLYDPASFQTSEQREEAMYASASISGSRSWLPT